MWGGSWSSDSIYFTTYSVYTLAVIGNNSLRDATQHQAYADLVDPDKIVSGALWLVDQQRPAGNWVGHGSDYLKSNNTLSAWALRALIFAEPYSTGNATQHQKIMDAINKSVAYFVANQNTDGGWGDYKEGTAGKSAYYTRSNPYTTGMIV
ncbi:MAG: hypothetical protein ACXQS2_05250 [Methermicoccaceae archaeon]